MASIEEESGLEEENTTNAWCQLVCTHECRPPILVTKDTFTFGRSPGCDMSFVGCKFMSGNHCFITRDDEGQAWLHDTSTNGTLINGKKVKAGQVMKLCNKDEVKIVHRKELDIGFVFHDLQFIEEEEALENTQEYDLDSDLGISSKDKDISKRNENKQSTAHASKRPHNETESTSETDSPTPKKQHIETDKTKKQNEIEVVKKSNSAIAENLICTICQDIFHDCISLQPCMHSYCASCYSQWMDRSTGCPTCRLKVKRISRNHLINNLVDAFLKEHPEKQRSKEEIEEMDSKNKITSDMLRPPRQRHRFGMPIFGGYAEDDDESDEEEVEELSEDDSDFSLPDDDDDDDDGDYDDDDDDDNFGPFGRHGPVIDSFGALFGLMSRSPSRATSRVCRQCPSSTRSSSHPPTTSTSTDSTDISDPPYTCSPSRSHILCLCCMEYMPDRRTSNNDTRTVPPQTCSVCHRAFCHMYWGCAGRCHGCLNEFKDMVFQGDDFVNNLINDNIHESTILKDYMTSKFISFDEMMRTCLEKLDSKEYHPKDSLNMTSTTVVCQKCAFRNLQELAYQYRRDIPRQDLPDEVTVRQDCYWGRNCRTQKTALHHARNFNHICEQTRFT